LIFSLFKLEREASGQVAVKNKAEHFSLQLAAAAARISTHFHRQGEFSTGFQPKIAELDDSRIAELCSQG
jgi:hypothetical protein